MGRGAYGVVRRVIDKNSGNQYAAKFLRFPDHLVKSELETELEMLTLLDHTGIIQVIDGYEDKKRLIIVMEIVTGGELLQRLMREDTLTESEVAFYIRQLLLSVEHMHAKSVVHLDLKLENLFLAQHGSDELKLIDFGFARRWNPRLPLRVKYATPEYCAPEVAAGNDVTPAADMWSVGVIVYILLSGISPFHKPSARETLLKVKEGSWEFDGEAFINISVEARDFITKCLTKDPKKRITASDAIEHSFMELAHHRGLGDRINLEKIRGYAFRRKWERGQESVKTFAQPRPLSAIMAEIPIVAPPCVEVEVDVPILDLPGAAPGFGGAVGGVPFSRGPPSDSGSVGSGKSLTLEAGAAGMLQVMGPLSLVSGAPSTVGSGGSSEWGREYEDEDTWYEWSSSYQTGPDTFLVPKSDSGLSMRLAKYRRSGGKGGKEGAAVAGTSRMGMRERRDLRDLDKAAVMAEDDSPSLTKHTGKKSVWQLKSMVETADGTSIFPPIFKEKIRDKAYNVGDSCTLHIHVIGNPTPAVSWYRNDELLTEGGRVRTSSSEEGRYSLTILSTKPNDFGVYKCVARNKHGKVTCRARMLLGDCPGRPGRPHVTKVSDHEIYMIWEEPETDGNSYILAYRVDWHRPGDERWTTATYSIDEQALVKGLQPDTSYRFRIAAVNKFGTSPYSWASVEIRTKKKGAGSIDIDSETKRILLRSRQARSRPSPDPSPATSPTASTENLSKLPDDKDLGLVEREVFLQERTDPRQFLEFGSEIWKGRFTLVRNVKPKEGRRVRRVAKIMPYDSRRQEDSVQEWDMLKNVRQEHIVRLYEAYQNDDAVVLVFEKLYGENVARSLSLKNRYSEQQVSGIIKQVLDALQFLHHRGIVHLNLQPDNVIMVSRRRMDIKLIDFGRARKISTYEGERVERLGTGEFMAPEKVAKESVGVAADVWGVGLLAFILLSGVSPFQAESDEDVYTNVLHVRYDAHQIYHNVTKYALKFIYQTLKRNAKSRLTTEECLEHRWLMLNTPMIKMRKAAIFPTEKLRLFEEDYIRRRLAGGGPSEKLMSVYGIQDRFSDSEDDLFPNQD